MAHIALDADETAWLAAVPQPSNEAPTSLSCYLQFGHPGPHAALGQPSGDKEEFWVRWTLRSSEIVTLDGCPVTFPNVSDGRPEPDLCLLFDGHPGKHTFERPW